MPFPNEHACRVADPSKFETFRRQEGRARQPDIIFGIKDGKSTAQSFRYPVDRFTEDQARASCLKHPGAFEPAAAASVFWIDNQRAAVAMHAAIDGQAGQRLLKEIIRTGHYIKEKQGIEFTVTHATLAHWAATFQEMAANGVRVPIPDDHDTFGKAHHNQGFVVDMFVDGDSLMAVCELIGDEAQDLATRNDVSVGIPQEIIDGKGRRYVTPIEHLAFTPTPLITGLGKFIPIAASRTRKVSVMDLKALGKALGIEDLEDANAVDKITAAFAERGTKATAVEASLGEHKTKLEAAESGLKAAREELAAKTEPVKVDAVTLELAQETREGKLGTLVANAKITPAVKDRLHAIFLGADGARLKASISNGSQHIFQEVVSALDENDPVKLKEQTGPQAAVLMSSMAKGGKNPLMEDAQRRAKAAVA